MICWKMPFPEEYYSCDVVVNGKTFYSVGIRPKGNTSLSSIVNDPDTDRYSFKLEFDHYIEGQTCYGLDKLILNNNYADATNMKEAIVYDMYQYLGVDASLYNYAKISVNGDYRGVYLALEAVEDSFMLRNYGTEDGNLYKPESMGIGGGVDGKDGDGWQMEEKPDGEDFCRRVRCQMERTFRRKVRCQMARTFRRRVRCRMARTFRGRERCQMARIFHRRERCQIEITFRKWEKLPMERQQISKWESWVEMAAQI